MTAAWTHPIEFVRVVAGLMPKEMQATIPDVHLERLSNAELASIIAEGLSSGMDPEAPPEGAPIIQ
jgi:hypothetical protein